MRRLIAQFTQFGIVGAIGLVVNVGLFTLLRTTVLAPEHNHEGPLVANVIATAVSIFTNWLGNRFWTFRKHRGKQLMREAVEFTFVNLGGLVISFGCLWVSHYVLGYTSVLADNISSNGIGLVLGMIFRFTLYKLWVFKPHADEPEPSPLDDSVEPWTASLPIIRELTEDRHAHQSGAGAPAPDAPRAD